MQMHPQPTFTSEVIGPPSVLGEESVLAGLPPSDHEQPSSPMETMSVFPFPVESELPLSPIQVMQTEQVCLTQEPVYFSQSSAGDPSLLLSPSTSSIRGPPPLLIASSIINAPAEEPFSSSCQVQKALDIKLLLLAFFMQGTTPPPPVDADDTPLPKRVHVDPGSDIPRQTIDYSLRLPQGWKNVAKGDRSWIGRSLFVAKGKLSPNLKLWWHPPPCKIPAVKPVSEEYHQKRLLLWMPRRMWNVNFICPTCDTSQSLRSKGIYKHIRIVIDFKDFYYLAGEYMDCRGCNCAFISWDRRILDQLTDGVRARFPAVLTSKYACDRSVIALMRSRTLGKIYILII